MVVVSGLGSGFLVTLGGMCLGFNFGSCGGWVGVWVSGLSVVLTRLGGFILGGSGFFLGSGTWVVFGLGLAWLAGWLLGGCWGGRSLLGDRFFFLFFFGYWFTFFVVG